MMKFPRLLAALPIALQLTVVSLAGAATGDLFPKGDAFCFTFYSTSDADSLHALTNGATAIGPFYGDQAVPLANAARWNTKVIYKVKPPSMAGIRTSDFDKPGFVWPPAVTISNEVAAIVNAVSSDHHIAMWDIEPEELRSWKPAQLGYLKLVSTAIHANDSEQRPVYMYECNNRAGSALAPSLAWQDVSAKGTYVNVIDNGAFITNRIWARWSLEQSVKACALGNPSAVPWIVLWMASNAPAGSFPKIADWCRHDAYLGLIMGGKGIEIWSGARGRRGFSNKDFQAYFDGYLSVARDLNGPLHLAPVFLFGTKQTNVTMNITSGPAQLELVYQKTTNAYPPVTYLSAKYDGTEYLFIVNSAEEPVTATFSGLPAFNHEDLFASGITATPGGNFTITLPPLAVKAFRFGAGKLSLLNGAAHTATPTQTSVSSQPHVRS